MRSEKTSKRKETNETEGKFERKRGTEKKPGKEEIRKWQRRKRRRQRKS